MDCPDIRQVIHWGIPSTVKQYRYVQEIRCTGRDNLPAQAILISDKISSYSEIAMKKIIQIVSNLNSTNNF